MLKLIVRASVLMSLGCSVAISETIRIEFQGTVDMIATADGVDATDYIGSEIVVGTSFTGYYDFDSTAQDISLGLVPDQAVYRFDQSPFEMFVEMGSFTFRSNPTERQILITASNDSPPLGGLPGGDLYTVSSTKDELVIGANGLNDFRPEMVLHLVGGDDVRDGVELLLSPEEHAMYPDAAFIVQGIDPTNQDNTFLINSGDVVFTVVPEPASVNLALFALFCIGWRLRERDTSRPAVI
jgi:hypothetical protein